MLFDLFLKFWVTPENVIGLVLDIIIIVSMCLIFSAWKESWWKSLIPIYGTYLIYKHTWQGKRWLFLITLIFEIVNNRSMAFIRRHVVTNLFYTIKTYIETQQIDIDISINSLIICLVLFLVSGVIIFILTRITYMKACDSLEISNVFLKIGTFILPEIFLLVDYIYYKNKVAKKANFGTNEERMEG